MTRAMSFLRSIYVHEIGRYAGFFGLSMGAWAVHVGVRRDHWVWGADTTGWYDGPIHHYGLGPFLLVCWMAALEGGEDDE